MPILRSFFSLTPENSNTSCGQTPEGKAKEDQRGAQREVRPKRTKEWPKGFGLTSDEKA